MAQTHHEPVVTLDGLTKRYGRRTAVDRMSVRIPRGVVAGLIGPNGAGKTTAMAMLLGLVRPTAGSGRVLGEPLGRPAAYLHRVGALIEGPAFYPHLTGRENLRVLAVAGGHDPAAIGRLIGLVGLGGRGDDRVRGYSLGMRQRLGIAAALLGDPDLLILDEPSNGLDPAGIHEMRELIGGLARANRTILVSSHVLSELQHVCDWLIVIDAGRVAFHGPAGEFMPARSTLVAAPEHGRDLGRLGDLIAARGLVVRREAGGVVVSVADDDPAALAAGINRAAMHERIVLTELRLVRPDLESRYLSLVGRETP